MHVHDDEPLAPSNGIRLSAGEWTFVLIVTAVGCSLAPHIWTDPDPARHTPHYRVPHELNEDYWYFERLVERTVDDADVVILGDSVVWGAYVAKHETLSSHLSTDDSSVANLGLQGAHPAALAGLIEHFASAIRDKGVILHLNPLWMSSPRHDLTQEKEHFFNHPALVPQLQPWIPCYRASLSDRIGNVVRRNVDFMQWTRHLQHAFFDHQDIPSWTVDHPNGNLLAALSAPIPPPTDVPLERPISWTERGIRPQTYPWVDLTDSIQWAAYRHAIDVLRDRNNHVLVLLGPFNEHLLKPQSRARFRSLTQQMIAWLTANDIPLIAPDPLPSDLYADASHPLALGYARLAAAIRTSGLLDRLR